MSAPTGGEGDTPEAAPSEVDVPASTPAVSPLVAATGAGEAEGEDSGSEPDEEGYVQFTDIDSDDGWESMPSEHEDGSSGEAASLPALPEGWSGAVDDMLAALQADYDATVAAGAAVAAATAAGSTSIDVAAAHSVEPAATSPPVVEEDEGDFDPFISDTPSGPLQQSPADVDTRRRLADPAHRAALQAAMSRMPALAPRPGLDAMAQDLVAALGGSPWKGAPAAKEPDTSS